jgi:DNA-directed RNA polymerase specialized sigma24 family protein
LDSYNEDAIFTSSRLGSTTAAEAGEVERNGMSHHDSISRWIQDVKQGNSAAVTALWHEYFEKLVRLARSKLGGVTGRMADEEDVALSAFKSFCKAAEQGRFPNLADRDDLWRLLISITARKAVDLQRHEGRQRRGGGRVRGESGFRSRNDQIYEISEVIGEAPTPELIVQLVEEFELRISELAPDLRQIALDKMEGFTNPEIAKRQGCAVRTVERRLHLIRRTWEESECP